VLLAETDEGYKNLIKLVSSGYTEGFYYRPRIRQGTAWPSIRKASSA
jgi:DNA polymerase III alpha subunit